MKHKGNKYAYEDSKWGLDVKERAGAKCEYCGSMRGLQSHHIFTRSLKSVRWYRPNGVALCMGHHFFLAHKKPHEFRDWITEVRGQAWWDDLNLKANTRHVVFK